MIVHNLQYLNGSDSGQVDTAIIRFRERIVCWNKDQPKRVLKVNCILPFPVLAKLVATGLRELMNDP